MRLIKLFGFATVVTAAAMAFIGATSASAVTELEKVVLCKAKEDPCSAANTLPAGTIIHGELASGTSSVLLTSLGNLTCTGSLFLGAILPASTNPTGLAHGEITAMSFTGCTLGGSSCSVTFEHLNYLIVGELNEAHTAYEVLVTEIAPNGQPQWHETCGELVNCKFGSSKLLFEALLDEVNHDMVLDILQELNRAGGLCPSTSIWHAKYLTRCLNPVNTLIACWLKME